MDVAAACKKYSVVLYYALNCYKTMSFEGISSVALHNYYHHRLPQLFPLSEQFMAMLVCAATSWSKKEENVLKN